MKTLLFALPLAFALQAPLGAADSAAPSPTPSTYARYIPERKDDFAWENDLIAFRAYGPALAGSKEHEDSGIDVWSKRVSYPIIDRWYAQDKQGKPYHKDHGEGLDNYHTGSSRGCGGLGIWKDGKIVRSGVYKQWKLVSQAPEKTVFELTYLYDVDGVAYDETKRVTIELGKRLFHVEAAFTRDGKPASGLDIAVGVSTHGGKAKTSFAPDKSWMACWEAIEGSGLGTGVAIAPARVSEMREVKSPVADECHALLVTKTDAAGKVDYYAGYGWEKAGEITTPALWEQYLGQFAAGLSKAH